MNQKFRKALISLASAVVGGALVLLVIMISPSIKERLGITSRKANSADATIEDIFRQQDGIRNNFDDLFNDDFLNQNDPFREMKKMREKMEKRMHRFDTRRESASNPFDSWFSTRFGGGSINDITKREDDNFVYYDISVDDINSASVNTKIENGYITITGTMEKKSDSEDKSNQTMFKSSFTRTFPLPEHVDSNKMEMTPEKNKIILRFPKITE